MLLQNKNAIIYGAAGSLGSAVARVFAKAGAKVFLCGYKPEPLKKLEEEINTSGGKSKAFLVDALNEKDVNDLANKVVKEYGTLDVSFNLINYHDLQGVPLADMSLEDYERPVRRAVRSHFITATAAARIMRKQRSGVLLSLTATPAGIGYPLTGGFGAACHFIENFSTALASEIGVYGVRAVNIRSAGSPDSKVFKDAIESGGDKVHAFIKKMEDDTMLKRMPLMNDIANTALFLSSDMAAGITGVTVDVTCGTTTALNYKIAEIAFLQRESE